MNQPRSRDFSETVRGLMRSFGLGFLRLMLGD